MVFGVRCWFVRPMAIIFVTDPFWLWICPNVFWPTVGPSSLITCLLAFGTWTSLPFLSLNRRPVSVVLWSCYIGRHVVTHPSRQPHWRWPLTQCSVKSYGNFCLGNVGHHTTITFSYILQAKHFMDLWKIPCNSRAVDRISILTIFAFFLTSEAALPWHTMSSLLLRPAPLMIMFLCVFMFVKRFEPS